MPLSDIISSTTAGFTGTNAGSIFTSTVASGALSALGSGIASIAGPGALSALGAGLAPGNSLAGANARSDPLLSFCWYAQMPTITPSPSSSNTVNQNSPSSSLSNLVGNAASSLASTLGGSLFTSSSNTSLAWYYVEEAQLPFRNFGVKSIFRDGRHRHYVDTYGVDNLTLHFYLDSSNTALQYLQAWQNNLISPFSATNSATSGGGFGRPSQYKLPIYIYILDVTKSQMAIIEYTECWPITLGSLQLDSGSSTRLTGQVPFSVGDVFINIVGVAQSLVQGVISNPSQFPSLLARAGSLAGASAISSVTSAASSAAGSLASSITSAL